jgi:hypothetical protein
MYKIIAKTFTLLALCLALVFAQQNPKLAVHLSGATDDINKSLGDKLLADFAQNGKYAMVKDSKDADFVYAVSITEGSGAYFISASIIETENSWVVEVTSIDSYLNSQEEIARVSGELVRSLFKVITPTTASATASASVQYASGTAPTAQPRKTIAVAAVSSEKKRCMDRLVFGVKDEIPRKLQDCSVEFGKNKAKAIFPFSRVPAEDLDPQRFMTKCVVNGVKEVFSVADRFAGSVESFIQMAVSASLSGGNIDVQKLLSAASDMGGLLKNIERNLENISEYELCREPIVPVKSSEDEGEEEKGVFSLGFRVGFNLSHVYEEDDWGNSGSSDRSASFQLGMAFDFALTDWFHLQPNVMFIRKGAEYRGNDEVSNYLEFPLLVSLKFSVVRLNAGPYFSLCAGSSVGNYESSDFGFSYGFGVDIESLYIGIFYDNGWASINKKDSFKTYNRTIGFNLGYNL